MRLSTVSLCVWASASCARPSSPTPTVATPEVRVETAGTITTGGEVPAPRASYDQREELLSVAVTTHTLRPARRDASDERIARLRVPAGFRIAVFARDLQNPRTIVVHPGGDVYVAEREAGRVRLLRDADGDGTAEVSRVVLEGLGEKLSGVHGLALQGNELYLVTETRILAAAIQPDGGLGEPRGIVDDLPDGSQHPNRTMAFGPDGMLYVSVGSACNACVEPNPEHATLIRMRPDGSDRRVFARGLRNTIGFGWHPKSGRLYGLDHNTDARGNDWPVEELNHIEEGRHYGWPFCWGDRQIDHVMAVEPDGETRAAYCAKTEPAVLGFTAHSAPMQMAYYTAGQFPAEYRGDAFVTLRGSWNRNPATGYGVARLRHDASGMPVRLEMFAEGWLVENGQAQFGRLMGLAVARDGALLVGDDENGVIYRIAYAEAGGSVAGTR
jgi:glucose/arabinose dehydrogenase